MDVVDELGLPSSLGIGLPEELMAAMFWLSAGLLFIGIPLWGLELLQLRRTGGLDAQRWRGMATSLLCLVPYTVVQTLLAGGLGLALAEVWAAAPVQWPVTAGTAVVAVLLADLAYYIEHRLSHRIGALWAWMHSVHHSAEHFDQSVAARVTFLEHFLNLPAMASLVIQVALGLHPVLVLLSSTLVLAWQQWIHTESVGKMPLFDGWLNTPSNHRAHHGANPSYLDANYGGILMVWDRLLGTYVPETEPVRYGLVHRLHGNHPLEVHLGETPRWWAHVRAGRDLFDRLGRAIAPPEAWHHDGSAPGSADRLQ